MLIQGPLRVGISACTSFSSAIESWSERGSSGSSSGSARFQKLVGENSDWPAGNGVTTSSGPMATGGAVTGGAPAGGVPPAPGVVTPAPGAVTPALGGVAAGGDTPGPLAEGAGAA